MSLFLAFAAAMAASMAHAAPQGLELYGRLPTIEQLEISPDGAKLAMVTTDGEERSVIIRGTGPDSKGIRSPAGQIKVRGITWVGSKDLIVTTSKTSSTFDVAGGRREWMMAFDMNADTGELRRMLDVKARESMTTRGNVRDGLNVIAGSPIVINVAGQPKVFLKGLSVQGYRYVLTLYRDDLNSGRPWLIETGGETTEDWVIGPDGKILAEKRLDRTNHWSIRLRTPAGDKEIQTGPGTEARMMGMGRTPDAIAVSSYGENGDVGIYEYGPEGQRKSFGEAGDVGAIYDPATNLLIGVSTEVGDEIKTTFFSERDQKAWDAVTKAFPGARVTRTSWSDDRRKIVVKVDSPVDGPAYSLVDLDAKKAEWLSLEYEGLNPDLIASIRPIAFKAQDGLQLSGYVYLPHGSNGKNLPLVVLPHGGPETRDYPGYDWLAQGIASRGYAVLKVNFRGSSGLGKAFRDAGAGEWGGKMQTDLSDGVRYLASQGIIDPRRVCIVGGSYGGYAALAGATTDRGVYRCAVSYGGVSDLVRMATYVKETRGERSAEYLRLFIGADQAGDAVLAQRSPALLADKVDIPVLLIHGKDDTVVPLSQSQEMQAALNKAGKPTDLIVLDGEDHWLTSGATRLQMLKATMAFVEKNNPPN